MIGKKITDSILFYYWYIFWMITPFVMIGLVVFIFIDQKPIELNGYNFPLWTHILGNCMSASVLVGIIGWAIYAIIDVLFIHKKVNKKNIILTF
jgi:hypothetical protein